MTNGRFNTSKCRGMLPQMGVLYTHSPKSPSPYSNFPKKKKLQKKFQKKGSRLGKARYRCAAGGRLQVGGLGPAGDQQSSSGRGSTLGPTQPAPFFLKFFFLLFAHVVNYFSLVSEHARLAQTSPQNFKHP
jgi:hypothetical protein